MVVAAMVWCILLCLWKLEIRNGRRGEHEGGDGLFLCGILMVGDFVEKILLLLLLEVIDSSFSTVSCLTDRSRGDGRWTDRHELARRKHKTAPS